MGLLENRVALITGSSRGIGRAIALKFAQEGANIVINYNHDQDGAKQVAEEIKLVGREVLIYKGSVTDGAAVIEMIQITKNQFGKIDILVNNAGVNRDGFLMTMRESDWDDVINTNLKGMFYCCKEIVKVMIGQRSGNIINMTSLTGVIGQPGQTNYAATKGGIISFTKSLAKEMAGKNIRVNAIAPGFIETDMIKKTSEEILEKNKQFIPMKRFGTPAEVANAALFLASNLSSYMTGQVLNISGGQFM